MANTTVDGVPPFQLRKRNSIRINLFCRLRKGISGLSQCRGLVKTKRFELFPLLGIAHTSDVLFEDFVESFRDRADFSIGDQSTV